MYYFYDRTMRRYRFLISFTVSLFFVFQHMQSQSSPVDLRLLIEELKDLVAIPNNGLYPEDIRKNSIG